MLHEWNSVSISPGSITIPFPQISQNNKDEKYCPLGYDMYKVFINVYQNKNVGFSILLQSCIKCCCYRTLSETWQDDYEWWLHKDVGGTTHNPNVRTELSGLAMQTSLKEHGTMTTDVILLRSVLCYVMLHVMKV